MRSENPVTWLYSGVQKGLEQDIAIPEISTGCLCFNMKWYVGDFKYVKLKPNRGCRYNLLRFQSDKASSSRSSSSSSPSLSACGSTKRNDNSFNAYNNTIHGKWFGPRNISCLSRVHVVFRKTCWWHYAQGLASTVINYQTYMYKWLLLITAK